MNAAYRLPAFPHAPHEGPPGTAKVQLRPIHPPYVRRLAGLLLALGTAGLIVAAELFATSAAPSGPANTPPGATRPIALDQRVCQEIGMTVDGFRGVSVRFAPSPRPSTVLAELREVTPAGELPIVRLTDVPIPPEGGPAWVRFAPITQSAGRRYRLDLSPSQSPAGVPAGQAPSVLVSRQNWYTGGRLMVGGREQWGDLVFTTDVEPPGLGAAWAGGRARSSAYCWSIAYHLALAWILWVAIGRGEDPAGGRGQNEKFVAIRALTGSLALVSLYVSPWSASSLPVIPDSVEYAVTAQRLALFGRYDVVIGGSSWPSIYPPGFPTLLSAVSAVAPAALGVGILVVLSSAVLAVLIAVRIGSRAAGPWAGALAGVALIAQPAFRTWAQLVMSDVPAVAFALGACWVFLRMRSTGQRVGFLPAGAIVGAVFLIRPLYAVLALPFAVEAWRRRGSQPVVLALIGLFAPLLAGIGASALYNVLVFGEWSRTGYHYWFAVPNDYPGLTVSAGHLRRNLLALSQRETLVTLALGLAGMVLLARRSAPGRDLLRFGVLGILPITVFHLFYFFPDPRYHLLLVCLLAMSAGIALGGFVPRWLDRRPAILAVLLFVALTAVVYRRGPDAVPLRRIVAESLARSTPPNALIVSGLEPIYLEPLVIRGTAREVLPVSRRVDPARRLVVRHRIPNLVPPPVDAFDYRADGLKRAGAREVMAYTAVDDVDYLRAAIHAGRPVFVETTFLSEAERLVLEQNFRFEAVDHYDWIARLAERISRSAFVREPGTAPRLATGEAGPRPSSAAAATAGTRTGSQFQAPPDRH